MKSMVRYKYIEFSKVNRSMSEALKIYNQRVEDAVLVHDKFSHEFIDRECPVCGLRQSVEIDRFHDTYGVARCQHCMSVFVNPCPTVEALKYYYNNCACNEMLGHLYRERAREGDQLILSSRTLGVIDIVKDVLEKVGTSVNILEVGCNSGAFLTELKSGLKQEGIGEYCNLVGVDIDEVAVKKCTAPDLELYACPVEEFARNSSSKFDVVLHFELIEHLPDPYRFMRSVWSLMNPGGIQYFHTPNALGLDNSALGWNATRLLAHGIFPPMHLNAFTTQNVVHFALRGGFSVMDIKTPGKLDVDMVRMMCDELPDDSVFSAISTFDKDQLAIVQELVTTLYGSSHMSVLLSRLDG